MEVPETRLPNPGKKPHPLLSGNKSILGSISRTDIRTEEKISSIPNRLRQNSFIRNEANKNGDLRYPYTKLLISFRKINSSESKTAKHYKITCDKYEFVGATLDGKSVTVTLLKEHGRAGVFANKELKFNSNGDTLYYVLVNGARKYCPSICTLTNADVFFEKNDSIQIYALVHDIDPSKVDAK